MISTSAKLWFVFPVILNCLQFSTDGLAYGQEITAEWKADDGNEKLLACFQIEGIEKRIQSKFSSTGKMLMMLVYNFHQMREGGTVHVWNLELKRKILQTEFRFCAPEFLDSRFLICSSIRGVDVWSLETGERVSRLDHQAANKITTLDAGNLLVTLADQSRGSFPAAYTVKLWSVNSWADAAPKLKSDPLIGPILADDGKVLIGCKQEPRRLIAWDTNSGEKLWTIKLTPFQSFWNLDRGGKRLFLVNEQGSSTAAWNYHHAEAIDIHSGESISRITPPEAARVAGTVITIPELDEYSVAKYGSDNERSKWTSGPIRPVFLRRGKLLAWDCWKGEIGFELDIEAIGLGQPRISDEDYFVAMSLTEKIYAVQRTSHGSSSNQTSLVDLRTGMKLDGDWELDSAVSTWKGQLMAQIMNAREPDQAVVYRLPSDTEVCSLAHAQVNRVAFDPMGEKIVTTSKSEIRVWDLTSLQDPDNN